MAVTAYKHFCWSHINRRSLYIWSASGISARDVVHQNRREDSILTILLQTESEISEPCTAINHLPALTLSLFVFCPHQQPFPAIIKFGAASVLRLLQWATTSNTSAEATRSRSSLLCTLYGGACTVSASISPAAAPNHVDWLVGGGFRTTRAASIQPVNSHIVSPALLIIEPLFKDSPLVHFTSSLS